LFFSVHVICYLLKYGISRKRSGKISVKNELSTVENKCSMPI
jgi:hypothetical protein